MVPRPLQGQLSKPPGACAVLRCSAGWLLAEVTLFQSHPSALAIRWSAPCHLRAGVLLCDQILTGVWKSPPGCLVPSTSFPTGRSLSRGLGRPEDPHLSASPHSLHLSPSSSPEELSGLQGKPDSSKTSLLYSWCFPQTFCERLASSLFA